jgi:type III secretory pathway component EscV
MMVLPLPPSRSTCCSPSNIAMALISVMVATYAVKPLDLWPSRRSSC